MELSIDIDDLAAKVKAYSRRGLAQALTLVESSLASHEQLALQLFARLPPAKAAFRLGITGPPGAGKSSVIEQIVLNWSAKGESIAVLTVDPSSRRTGGSLLGDKTRMAKILSLPQVFIRPSPSGSTLGGLGRRTPLMCALLERAGFSKIVVETVGVGQSEYVARYLVDKLMLVALPGAGDDVQGIKRGIMEEVDLVAVNKADLGASKAAVASLRSALKVFRREVPVFSISARSGEGFPKLLECLDKSQAKGLNRDETYFFDQHSIEVLRLRLEQSPRWRELRELVAQGKLDYLGALPRLEEVLSDHQQIL